MTLSGHRFAPCACFGNAESMLSEDVCFYVVFGADDEKGEDARIGVVEIVEVDEGIDHRSLALD